MSVPFMSKKPDKAHTPKGTPKPTYPAGHDPKSLNKPRRVVPPSVQRLGESSTDYNARLAREAAAGGVYIPSAQRPGESGADYGARVVAEREGSQPPPIHSQDWERRAGETATQFEARKASMRKAQQPVGTPDVNDPAHEYPPSNPAYRDRNSLTAAEWAKLSPAEKALYALNNSSGEYVRKSRTPGHP